MSEGVKTNDEFIHGDWKGVISSDVLSGRIVRLNMAMLLRAPSDEQKQEYSSTFLIIRSSLVMRLGSSLLRFSLLHPYPLSMILHLKTNPRQNNERKVHGKPKICMLLVLVVVEIRQTKESTISRANYRLRNEVWIRLTTTSCQREFNETDLPRKFFEMTSHKRAKRDPYLESGGILLLYMA